MPRRNPTRTDRRSGLQYRNRRLPDGTRYREYQAPASSRVNNNMYRSPYEGVTLPGLADWANQAAQQPGARNNQFLQTFAGNYDTLLEQYNREQQAREEHLRGLEATQAAQINADIQEAYIERQRLGLAANATPEQRRALERDYGTANPKELAVIAEAYQSALNNAGKPGGGLALSEMMQSIRTRRSVAIGNSKAEMIKEAKKDAEEEQRKFSLKNWAMRTILDPLTIPTAGIGAWADLGEGLITGENSDYARGAQSRAGMTMTGLGKVASYLEPAMNAYYAGQYSQLHGGSTGDQFRAFMGGVYNLVPGLGDNINRTINTREAATAAAMTSSREKREELKKDGELLSFGNYMTGYGGDLRGEARRHYAEQWKTISAAFRTSTISAEGHKSGSIDKSFGNPYKKASDGGWVHNTRSGLYDALFVTFQDPTLYVGLGGTNSFYDYAIRNVPKTADGELLQAATRLAAADYITRSRAGQYALERATTLVSKAAREFPEASDRLIARVLSARGEVGRETVRNVRQAITATSGALGDDAIRRALIEEFASGRWRMDGRWVKRYMYGSTPVERARLANHKSLKLAKVIQGLQSGRLRSVSNVVGEARTYRAALEEATTISYLVGTDEVVPVLGTGVKGTRGQTIGAYKATGVEGAAERNSVLASLLARGRPTEYTADMGIESIIRMETNGVLGAAGNGRVYIMTADEAEQFAKYGIIPDYLEDRLRAMTSGKLGMTFDEMHSQPTVTGRQMFVRIGDPDDVLSIEYLSVDDAGRMVWVGEADIIDYYNEHFARVLASYNVVDDPEMLAKALKPTSRVPVSRAAVHQITGTQKRPVPDVLNRALAKYSATGQVVNVAAEMPTYLEATRDDVLDLIDAFVDEGTKAARRATGRVRSQREMISTALDNAASHGYKVTREMSKYAEEGRPALQRAKEAALRSIKVAGGNKTTKLDRMISTMISAAVRGEPGALKTGPLMFMLDEMADPESLLGKYMWKMLDDQHYALYGTRSKAIAELNVPEPLVHVIEREPGNAHDLMFRTAAAEVEKQGFPRPAPITMKLSWKSLIDNLVQKGATFKPWKDETLQIPWDVHVRGAVPTEVPVHELADTSLYATLERYRKFVNDLPNGHWQRDLLPIIDEQYNRVASQARRGLNTKNNGERYQWFRLVEDLMAAPEDRIVKSGPPTLSPGKGPQETIYSGSTSSVSPTNRQSIENFVESFRRERARLEQEEADWYARVAAEQARQQEEARLVGKGIYEPPTSTGYHPDPTGRYPLRHYDKRTKKWSGLVKDSAGTTVKDPDGAPTREFISGLRTRAQAIEEAAATTKKQRRAITESNAMTPEERWDRVFEHVEASGVADDYEDVFQASVEWFHKVFPEGEYDVPYIDEESNNPLKDYVDEFMDAANGVTGPAKIEGNRELVQTVEAAKAKIKGVIRLLHRFDDPNASYLVPARIAAEEYEGQRWSYEEVAAMLRAATNSLKRGEVEEGSVFSDVIDRFFPAILLQGDDPDIPKAYLRLFVNEQDYVFKETITGRMARSRPPQTASELAQWMLPEGHAVPRVREAADVQAVGDWLREAVRSLPAEGDDRGLVNLSHAVHTLQKGSGGANEFFDDILTESKLRGDVAWDRAAPAKPSADLVEEATPQINNLFATARSLADDLDIPGLAGLVDEMRLEFSVERLATMLAPARLQAMEDVAMLDRVLRLVRGDEGAAAADEVTHFLNTKYRGRMKVTKRGVAKAPQFKSLVEEAEKLGEAQHFIDSSMRTLYAGTTMEEVWKTLHALRSMAAIGGTNVKLEYVELLIEEVVKRQNKQKGALPLWKLAALADAMTHDNKAVDELMRLYSTAKSRTELWNDARQALDEYVENTSLWTRIKNGGAEMALKALQRSPDRVYMNLAHNPNLQASHVEAFITELAAATKMHPQELAVIRSRAVKVAERVAAGGSEKEIEAVINDLYWALFRKHGVTRDGFEHWRKVMRNAYKERRLEAGESVRPSSIQMPAYDGDDIVLLANMDTVHGIDDGVVVSREGITTPQVLAQRGASVVVYSPDEILAGINRELARAGRFNPREHPIEALMLWFDDAHNLQYTDPVSGVKKSWAKFAGGYEKAFVFWKIMVTSRMFLGPIAFAGSLIQGAREDGLSGDEIWRSIALGASGSVMGMSRYRGRVSIINRVTAWLRGGHSPAVNIPGMTEWYARNARAIYGDGVHVLSPTPAAPGWWNARQRVLRGMTDDWVLLRNTDKMFHEEYARILNYQLRPEEDQVVEIWLRHFANGGGDRDAAMREIRDFLGTEDGALWAQRAHWTTDPMDAVETSYNMVAVYAGRQEIAAARMSTVGFAQADRIPLDQIKLWDANDMLAPVIHAQKSETHPFKAWTRFFREAAYGSANAPAYRSALARAFAERMETNFIRGGMPRQEAQDLAFELATHETNRILYRHDNGTIATRKLDWLFPFTGDRMHTAYMWTRLAGEKIAYNTSSAVFASKQVATAFNALREDGSVMRKNRFGQYVFTVPGSAQISALLGAPEEFELQSNITGFMSVTSEMSMELQAGMPVWAAAGGQFLPHPGGPTWTAISSGLALMFPDWLDPETTVIPKSLYSYLWPMGIQGGLLGSPEAQVWAAMFSSAAPWEMMNQQGVQTSNRLKAQIVQELIAEYRRKEAAAGRTPQADWFPSDEAIEKSWKASLEAWTMVRMLFPAAASWRFKDAETAQIRFAKFQEWTPHMSYSQQQRAWLRNHPEDYSFIALGKTKRLDKQKQVDFEKWLNDDPFTGSREQYAYDMFQGRVAYKTPDDLKKDVEEYARRAEFYTQQDAARELPPEARELELQRLEKEYPESAAYFRARGLAKEDLAVILTSYSPGLLRDRALDRWRRDNNMTYAAYESMASDIYKAIREDPDHQYRYNYWSTARASDVVYEGIVGKGTLVDITTGQLRLSVVEAVSHLQPVEQTKFWTEALVRLWTDNELINLDPNAALKLEGLYKQRRSAVYSNVQFKELMFPPRVDLNRDKDYSDAMLAKAENGRSAIAAMSDKAARLKEQIDAAAKRKDWRAVKQLAKERSAIFEEMRVMKNYLWADKEMSIEAHAAVMELAFVNQYGDKKARREAEAKVAQMLKKAPFFQFDEEAAWDNRSTKSREAYLADLVNSLNLTPEEGKAAGLLNRAGELVNTRLIWDYLTDFQRDLLEARFPADQIATWKEMAKAKPTGTGGGKSIAMSEIQYAYAMMRKYSQRGNMPKPKDYDAYLALPNNPVLRNQFLDEHPDVAEYIRRGGMANMPPVLRYIVTDIMIRNGKWEGEERSMTEITELAFAREQLARYTRRRQGERAPQTFDLWLNMPDGAEKDAYLKQHPEIEDWIQRGPMANMPEMYRDVVRDIMYRYNEWTSNNASDGISRLMNEYLATPSYARSEFLDKNPTLAAYLLMLKSPEEQQMQNKMEAYFAIPDSMGRKAYLQVNPDVQQYMLTARTKRYERFLNQVAIYMGQNPELFEKYLDTQNALLKDLLAKFAEPHMVQEAPWLGYPQQIEESAEGGRRRGATR